jgi:RNA polymerase sigma-70 factor (ECF subfamily)
LKPAGGRQSVELFEEIMLPHLDAAHNLARWLTGDDQDAQDVVQDAYLRALRFFEGYRGGDSKAWILEVVRNTFRTFRRRSRSDAAVPLDETANGVIADGPNAEDAVAGRQNNYDSMRAVLPAVLA